jgi:hypothetical protein
VEESGTRDRGRAVGVEDLTNPNNIH